MKTAKTTLLKTLPKTTAAAALAFGAFALQAQTTHTWQPTTGGTYSWEDTANWDTSAYPDAYDAGVIISGALTGAQTISLKSGTNYKLHSLSLGATSGTNAYTLSGGILDFSGATTPATITKISNTQNSLSVQEIRIGEQGLTIDVTQHELAMTGGTITGTGNLAIQGSIVGSNITTINISGSVTVGSGNENNRRTYLGSLGANVAAVNVNRTSNIINTDVVLQGNNTAFAGDINITKGVLGLYNQNSINNDAVVLNATGGTAAAALHIRVSGANAMTLAGLNGGATIVRGDTAASAVTLKGADNYVFDVATDATTAGRILALSVNMATDTASQTLTGVWNFAGGVTVTKGKLVAGSENLFNGTNFSLGTLLINGGTFATGVANANLGAADGGASLDIALTGGALDINGTDVGTIVLGNAAATQPLASNFSMSGGTLKITIADAMNHDKITGASNGTCSITGGTLDLSSSTGIVYTSTYEIFHGFGSDSSVSGLTITGYDTTHYLATLDAAGVLSFAANPNIPEPGSLALFAGAFAFAGAFTFVAVRRKRRSGERTRLACRPGRPAQAFSAEPNRVRRDAEHSTRDACSPRTGSSAK
ncbi:MAG: hypothetical protein LBK99_09275 [Opitutaceae bacterium]|jgi:hypothetical protein|nr:hypothetical protein [Opitutaceae bacterium]